MNQEKIAAGINYIRLLKKGQNVYDIAREMKEEVEYVKECIALARKNKDQAERGARVTLIPPDTQVLEEYYSGAMQVVKSVEVELMRPIIIKYNTEKETEFQTLMPVKIRIKRV